MNNRIDNVEIPSSICFNSKTVPEIDNIQAHHNIYLNNSYIHAMQKPRRFGP